MGSGTAVKHDEVRLKPGEPMIVGGSTISKAGMQKFKVILARAMILDQPTAI